VLLIIYMFDFNLTMSRGILLRFTIFTQQFTR